MAIYVDNIRIQWRSRKWCHLVADSLDELHVFAEELGLKRAWFQKNASYPHYDVTIEVRAKALRIGALKGSRIQIISCAKKLKLEQADMDSKIPVQISLFDMEL
ncbi:DUF4031 domain-containing protein [Hydrogenovibrio sp. SC-1]|uniref:DUF4031 domain-containing protein n=1 Tax=Hydrogenovibrio sp. SC-1 TaxID=2065820 RepID=UPI000C7A3DA4|nr:DUF4031 domain-containing protein [Hydrogenovibrio sp. SC-1]PLA73422.1 DUF4031 domain-containing protein [Hydrogenovibrio sp. SC-1]